MAGLSLNIGLQALLTSQAALETIGHNVANSSTPGYSRQDLLIQASSPLNLNGLVRGSGVQAESVRRVTDSVLTRRIAQQVSVVTRLAASLDSIGTVESLIAEPGEDGIGALMDGFFQELSALSTSPEDIVLRNGVTQAAQTLTGQFHQLADSLDQLSGDASNNMRSYAGEVNRLAEQVRGLNVEINEMEATGLAANDLRDQREYALRQLAEVIDIDYQEKPSGAVHVLIQGQLLVGTATLHEVEVRDNEDDLPEVWLEGGLVGIQPQGGAMGGGSRFLQEFVPAFRADLDTFARTLALEVNRAHSTGTTEDGGFRILNGSISLRDSDGDGDVRQELLTNINLDFPVQDGELYINVTDESTGEVTTSVIEIDPERTSVGEFLEALSSVPHMEAALDSLNRVTMFADSGHRFDFSRRMDSQPDDVGSFGGGRASHATDAQGPFALGDGDTLLLTGPVSTFQVDFTLADFEDITSASADEVAAVINSYPEASQNQIRAEVVGDQVVLQSTSTGTTSSFTITGGSSLGELGLAAGTVVTGHDTSVAVELSGSYTGSANQIYQFRPTGDGQVGTTPGLQVQVLTDDGFAVATLNVGEGYTPGKPLTISDGVQVSFSVGQLSATDNDVFETHLTSDSDTSDVLVAMGLNDFFQGNSATSIELNTDLVQDPSRIAASATGAVGDNGALLEILSLQTRNVDGLGGSFAEYYGRLVGDVGFEVSTTQNAEAVETTLLESLELRREQIAGVNVDEELVDMIRFEQAFSAAAQYIQVVQSLGETVLQLL